MSDKYRYDRKTLKHRKRHISKVLIVSFVIIGLLAASVAYLVKKTTESQQPISGPGQIVGHVSASGDTQTTTVVEPYFKMSIPTGWRQIAEVNNTSQYSITWKSFNPYDGGRSLTIYIDIIPTTLAVNRLLPLMSTGGGLNYGILSDNCANFSQGDLTKPVLAKWQGVNFYCNLPDRFDDQVGTGSTSGINTVSVTGAKTGTHQYFFLYTDRSGEPNYSVFYSIINSFQAT